MANGLTRVEEAALNDAVTIRNQRDRIAELEVFVHAVSACTKKEVDADDWREWKEWADELIK